MKSLSALVLSLSLVAAVTLTVQAEEKEDTKLDPSKLVGKWEYVSGMEAGKKVSMDKLKGTVQFKKDVIIVPGEKGKDFTIAYKITNKTNPAQIDMEIKKGPEMGKAVGLIALKDKQLHLAYVMVTDKGGKRPAKLESTKENNAFYFVLKPAK